MRSVFKKIIDKKNNQITIKNIKSVRPSFCLHPKYFNEILGKTVKKIYIMELH